MARRLDPVIRHAITPPIFDARKLHRERLVDVLHGYVPKKLVVIAAPPGYGKTTLLADFIAHTDLKVCWMRLTPPDRDLMRFAKVMQASLQRKFRRLRGRPRVEELGDLPPEGLARTFLEVIEERIDEPFVLALDDVQIANTSQPVLRFLDALLEELPEHVTLMAAGREVLEVSLAKLMADGYLAGLGPHDLAVTPDELRDLVRLLRGEEPTQEVISRTLEHTQGWITGIVLSGLLSDEEGPAFLPQSRPMVYEYLASVVLNRLPDDVRRFMLDASVLPVMSGAACDHVLARKGSHLMLARLLREGLFVTATESSPRTYEFHPQFRQFLLESLRAADRARMQRLQRRAADYFAGEGSIDEAVDLYFESGQARKALRLIEQHASQTFHAGRFQTLERWQRQVESAGLKAPLLLLHLAGAHYDRGATAQAEELLNGLETLLTSRSPRWLRAAAHNLRGFLALQRNQPQVALTQAQAASGLLARRGPPEEVARSLRLIASAKRSLGEIKGSLAPAREAVRRLEEAGEVGLSALPSALGTLAVTAVAVGDLMQAHQAAARAVELAEAQSSGVKQATAYNNLAWLNHLRGECLLALETYQRAIYCARQAASRRLEAVVFFGQGDVFNDLGLVIQAAECYGRGLALAAEMENLSLQEYGFVQTSVLHRRWRRRDIAYTWLRRAVLLREAEDVSITVRLQMAALEAQDNPPNAIQSLESILSTPDLEAQHQVLAHLFMAQALFVSGDVERAVDALSQALDIAGKSGMEQALAGELRFDPLLRDLARAHLAGHPVLPVVLARIDTMEALARRYQEPEEPETPGIELRALGTASVRVSGREVGGLTPLTRELLFFLADQGRVERDLILETFWPHLSTGRQVSNLHMALYVIRRVLSKESVICEGATYFLNPEMSITYDVPRFERAAAVAEGVPPGDPRRLFALTEAISAYGGTFLPEFSSDWVLERRRALERRYLDLLAAHAQEALARDRSEEAVRTLRQALAIDPYRDDLNRQFLEALGRLGRRNEIVAHYQRYVRLLLEDLGLDPAEEVRRLYDRLIG